VVAVALSIRLTSEDEARLDQLARRTGRSKTFYVREAIHEHLDDLEERFWADSVVREWEESGKQSRPAQELWDELGV
jgi:RHH-type rel operon transcriptional repressor/antitoxin RelB